MDYSNISGEKEPVRIPFHIEKVMELGVGHPSFTVYAHISKPVAPIFKY